MKRIFALSAASFVALAATAWGAGLCCNHGVHCIQPPCPACEDCSCPCDHGFHHCSCRKSEKAHRLIEELHGCDCCERISAAKKLGCRLHADFCCDPEVLTALIHALQCDTCWEVRRAAAWSIAMQNARTVNGVVSLYVASKLDPHYMVRDRSAEALDVLLVCRRNCFKEVFTGADELIKSLKGKYKPTSGECVNLIDQFCASCGGTPLAVTSPAPVIIERGMARPEMIPAPATIILDDGAKVAPSIPSPMPSRK